MLGGDQNDPSRMAKTLADLFIKGIDTGRTIRDTQAKHDGQMAFSAGFKEGFDEGKKQSSQTLARMADELLKSREKGKKNRAKPSTGKNGKK